MTLNGKRIVGKTLGKIKLGLAEPKWYDVVARLLPPFDLTKPQAIGLNLGRLDENDWDKANQIKGLHKRQSAKSEILVKQAKEKFGRPQKLIYPEDEVRKRFLREHPKELSRPLNLNENGSKSEISIDNYIENTENDDSLCEKTQEDKYQKAIQEFYSAREREETNQLSAIRQSVQSSNIIVQEMLNESIEKVIQEEQRLEEAKKNSS
jgi:hypothetical protein